MKAIKTVYENIGLPRLIIGLFFIFLVVASIALGFSPAAIFSDVLRRWLMYGTLVLAMVPGIQSGIGLNFGVSLGISAGLLGSVLAMEISFVQNWPEVLGVGASWATLLLALLFGVVMAAFFGNSLWLAAQPGKRLRDDRFHLCGFFGNRLYEYCMAFVGFQKRRAELAIARSGFAQYSQPCWKFWGYLK